MTDINDIIALGKQIPNKHVVIHHGNTIMQIQAKDKRTSISTSYVRPDIEKQVKITTNIITGKEV